MPRRGSLPVLGALILALLVPSGRVSGGSFEWRASSTTTSWGVPGNWYNLGLWFPPSAAPISLIVPGDLAHGGDPYSDIVYIGNGGTVEGGGQSCYDLYVGTQLYQMPQKGSGTLYLKNENQQDLYFDGMAIIGFLGTGVVEQATGTLRTLEGQLELGSARAGHGTYNLTAGQLQVGATGFGAGGILNVGTVGTGKFSQSGGTVWAQNGMWIGGANGLGTYEMSGGELTSICELPVNGSLLQLQPGGNLRAASRREALAPWYGISVGEWVHARYVETDGSCKIDWSGLQIGAGIRRTPNQWRDPYTARNPGADECRGYYTLKGSGGITTFGIGYLGGQWALQPAIGVGFTRFSSSIRGSTGFMYLGEDGWVGWIDGGRGDLSGRMDLRGDDHGALTVRAFQHSVGVLRGWSYDTLDTTHDVIVDTDLVYPMTHKRGIHMGGSAGSVGYGGPLENNGRIIADGYGYDNHILDLSDFAYERASGVPEGPAVINTIDNTSTHVPKRTPYDDPSCEDPSCDDPPLNAPCDNGWFAQNHGLLTLPPVPLAEEHLSDPNTQPYVWEFKTFCNWGEGNRPEYDPDQLWQTTASTGEIDLVNSLCFEVHTQGMSPGADQPRVRGSLLATDRRELQHLVTGDPDALLDLGWVPLAAWHLEALDGNGNPLAAPLQLESLKTRYDDTQLPPAAEQNLYLLQRNWTGTTWSLPVLEGELAVNPTSKTIEANPAGTGTFPLDDKLFAAVLPGWVWRGGTGNWDGGSSCWIADVDTLNAKKVHNASPNDDGHPVCIDRGGTVTLTGSMTGAQAAMILLGCNADAATNTLQVEGGTLDVYSLRLGAVDQDAKGAVLLSDDGTVAVGGDLLIGENGEGSFTQTGRTCTVDGIVHIGLYPTATGTCTLLGGTLEASRICVGTEGKGTLVLQGGSITGVKSLTIRSNMYASGTLQGYGAVVVDPAPTPPGGSPRDIPILTMNGKVIADGDGDDGNVLRLLGFEVGLRNLWDFYLDPNNYCPALPGIRNNIDNIPPYGSTRNGWFARNHGKLILPIIDAEGIHDNAQMSGTDTFAWGESIWIGTVYPYTDHTDTSSMGYNYSVDLINSVQVTFSYCPSQAGATIDIALLSPDRLEMTCNPLDPATEGVAIGFWNVVMNGFSTDKTTTLKFRYDNSGLQPADEAGLQVWMRVGIWGDWDEVTLTLQEPDVPAVDTVDHVICTESLDLAGITGDDVYFAVVLPDRCAGDVNGDGDVDVLDLLYFVDAFATYAGDEAFDWRCDFNGDAMVDVLDLLFLVDNFGNSCDAGQSLTQQTMQFEGAPGVSDLDEQRLAPAYEILEQAGLLDVLLDYIAEHPEAGGTQ